eukprot:ctg_1818.g299
MAYWRRTAAVVVVARRLHLRRRLQHASLLATVRRAPSPSVRTKWGGAGGYCRIACACRGAPRARQHPTGPRQPGGADVARRRAGRHVRVRRSPPPVVDAPVSHRTIRRDRAFVGSSTDVRHPRPMVDRNRHRLLCGSVPALATAVRPSHAALRTPAGAGVRLVGVVIAGGAAVELTAGIVHHRLASGPADADVVASIARKRTARAVGPAARLRFGLLVYTRSITVGGVAAERAARPSGHVPARAVRLADGRVRLSASPRRAIRECPRCRAAAVVGLVFGHHRPGRSHDIMATAMPAAT